MLNTSCSFCVAKNKISTDKFIRDSLVELYSSIDAPESIDRIQFSDVFTENAQIVRQQSFYDIEYVVEVGYDHEEQYIDQKKEYDQDLKKYVTRSVVKNRTVTDWQPYKGSESGLMNYATVCWKTGDDIDIGDKEETISKHYSDYSFRATEILEGLEPREATKEEQKDAPEFSTSALTGFAAKAAGNDFFYSMVKHKLPGDRHRKFSANWTSDSMHAVVYSVERYKLAFDYEGHKCFVKQFATEKSPHVYCSYKYIDQEDIAIKDAEKVKLNTDPQFQKNVKIYKAGTYGSLGLAVLSLGLSGVLGTGALIGLVIAVAGFFISMRFGKNMQKQGEAIQAETKNKLKMHKLEIQNKKIELLETRFAKMGYSPLTEEEKERFSLENEHKLTCHFYEQKDTETTDTK